MSDNKQKTNSNMISKNRRKLLKASAASPLVASLTFASGQVAATSAFQCVSNNKTPPGDNYVSSIVPEGLVRVEAKEYTTASPELGFPPVTETPVYEYLTSLGTYYNASGVDVSAKVLATANVFTETSPGTVTHTPVYESSVEPGVYYDSLDASNDVTTQVNNDGGIGLYTETPFTPSGIDRYTLSDDPNGYVLRIYNPDDPVTEASHLNEQPPWPISDQSGNSGNNQPLFTSCFCSINPGEPGCTP